MATLKQRLHRKNASGSYDTIHLETSSSLVMRPSGRTVEQDLEAYLPKVQDSDTVPESLNAGQLITGTTKAWLGRFGEIGHPYTHPTAKQCNYSYSHPTTKQCNYSYTHPSTKQCDAAAGSHTHSAANITSGTLAVARGGTGVTTIDALKSALGLGGGTQYSGMTYNLTGIAVGKPVLWGNEIWICVHVSGSTYYLSSTSIYGSTIFGSNNSYRRSTLAAMCAQFQNIIPADSLALAVNTTVNGVTAKIFCPSYEQYNGGFSYFNSDASRVCQASNYWTSSPASVGDVYCVSTYGNLYNDDGPSATRGFRPCVALAL